MSCQMPTLKGEGKCAFYVLLPCFITQRIIPCSLPTPSQNERERDIEEEKVKKQYLLNDSYVHLQRILYVLFHCYFKLMMLLFLPFYR